MSRYNIIWTNVFDETMMMMKKRYGGLWRKHQATRQKNNKTDDTDDTDELKKKERSEEKENQIIIYKQCAKKNP